MNGAPEQPGRQATEPYSAEIQHGRFTANGRRVAAEAVILPLEGAADPFVVLSWKDDFDG